MKQTSLISEEILQDNINLNHVSLETEEEVMKNYRNEFIIHPIYTRTLSLSQAIEVDKRLRLLNPKTCTYRELRELNNLSGATTILISQN